MQSIDTASSRPVHVRFISIRIAIQTRINNPLNNLQRGTKPWRQPISNGMIEIVSKDEIVAVYALLGNEGEGDAVLVVGFAVGGCGEVGGCGGRGGGEAAVVLFALVGVILRFMEGEEKTYLDSHIQLHAQEIRFNRNRR